MSSIAAADQNGIKYARYYGHTAFDWPEPHEKVFCKGASIYDVRGGWEEGGPQKADERNKIRLFVYMKRGGGGQKI